jgi:Flp pilus assembly pilin Flp
MDTATKLVCWVQARWTSHWDHRSTLDNERGANLVEYALLVALIALVCLTAVTFLGRSTCGNLSRVPEQAFSTGNNPTSC